MSRVSASALIRATGLIAAITVCARIAGFLRYLVFGASVGAGDVGTTYTSANLVPSVVFEVAAGGALASMVIPLIAGLPSAASALGCKANSAEADRITSAILTWSLLLTSLLAAALFVGARPIALLLFQSGQENTLAQTIDLGARFLKIFALQLPLYALTIVLAAYLQSRNRFFWAAVAPLISSCVVMASYGVYALMVPATVTVSNLPLSAERVLGWGTTLGVAAMALSVLIPSLKGGFVFTPRLTLPAGRTRKALGLAGSGLAAVAAQQGVVALILVLAVRAGGTGTLPLFQYGQAVYLLPFAILLIPIMTSVFPTLSELRLVGEKDRFSALALTSTQAILAFAAVGGAALWGAAIGLERFFAGIDRTGVRGVGAITAALAMGLIGYGVVSQSSRILNAALRPGDSLVVGTSPWLITAFLMVTSVLTSPPRNTADAATLFGLCTAMGMILGACIALAMVRDRGLTSADSAKLVRSCVIACGASSAASVGGLFLARITQPLIHGPWTAAVVGAVTGTIAGFVCLGLIALCDRSLALPVTNTVKGVLSKVGAKK